MKRGRTFAAIGTALGAMCLAAAAPSADKAQEKVVAAAMSGPVLTKAELHKIYSGRTWYWKDGAAYFRPNQRFEAWVKTGPQTTYGEGSWSVANTGQLCIRATWHSLSGNTKTFICYVHRIRNAIYQRELPRGRWYLFGHIPPQRGDEINKLEQGDHISAEYLRAKRYVTRHLRHRNGDANGQSRRRH